MAVFNIRLLGDPVLRTPSKDADVVDKRVRKLIKDLEDTLKSAGGLGLAAPQIGVSLRVFVWRNEDERGALINPRIIKNEGSETQDEGCLSIPNLSFPLERAMSVTVDGVDRDGGPASIAADGLTARIFQHEIDHLDGVLFIDRLEPKTRKEALKAIREMSPLKAAGAQKSSL